MSVTQFSKRDITCKGINNQGTMLFIAINVSKFMQVIFH